VIPRHTFFPKYIGFPCQYHSTNVRTLFTLIILFIRRSKKKYQVVFFYVVCLSLKPSGYYMYHRVLHSKPLYSANRIQFYVSYDFHKKVFPCYTMCVQRIYCAVRTGFAHAVQIKFSPQRTQIHSDKRYLHKTMTITK